MAVTYHTQPTYYVAKTQPTATSTFMFLSNMCQIQISRYICDIFQILYMHKQGMYAHIYIHHTVTGTNHSARNTVHLFDIYYEIYIAVTFQIKLILHFLEKLVTEP